MAQTFLFHLQCSVWFERRNLFSLNHCSEVLLSSEQLAAAIPLLPLTRARQSRGTDQGKGNPTARTNLAVSAHGTSDLISYLKYSLLNNSNIIIWPLSQNTVSFYIPVDHAHKKAKEKRQRSQREDCSPIPHNCRRQVCGKLNSSCQEQPSFAGRDRNSPQVTGSLLSPV